MTIFAVVFICLLVYYVTGDACVDDDGLVGKCLNVQNCTGVYKESKTCESDKFNSTVCCIPDEELNATLSEEFPPGCIKVWKQNKNIYIPSYGAGGILSYSKEFPHMAALGYDGENNKTLWACGGTLITDQYVLTAAHCLSSTNLGTVKYVRLGDLNLNSDRDDAFPQDFNVIETFRHPDNHPPSAYNDVAIVKLDKPCFINPYVIPACLNTKEELPDGTYSATGWGQLGYEGALAEHLQNMLIGIYNHTECKKLYSKVSKRRLSEGIDKRTQVCAGAPKIDTCPGDSGGPLQLYKSKDNMVYGVTSFGVACAISQFPGVYTKVSAFIPWIKSVILP